MESARNAWRYTNFIDQNGDADAPPPNTNRDSDEMLARVSRSEAESQSAYRLIEDQLRGVARRLDHTERSQTENNRAMTKAAAEINITAREQAQAFEQLETHVVGLKDRLFRIERQNAADGMKNAVKALHQGLSRLADQMSQTAHQSASQIAALAGNVEQVADKQIESRAEVDQIAHAMDARFTTVEVRLCNAEREGQSQASALEKTLATLAASKDAGDAVETELQRHATGLSQLNETLDRLSARFGEGEAQQTALAAQLKDSVEKFDAQANEPGSEHRLQVIEQSVTDLASRLELAESGNFGTAKAIEDGMRNLAARLDAADQRHRDAVNDLRTTANLAGENHEALDPPRQAEILSQSAMSDFDLPPFADHTTEIIQESQPLGAESLTHDAAAPVGPGHPFADHLLGADAAAAEAGQQARTEGAESFLEAARRSARAAASTDAEHTTGPFGFAWRASSQAETEPKQSLGRFALVATLALLIVAAVAAGAFLSRNLNAAGRVAIPARAHGHIQHSDAASLSQPVTPIWTAAHASAISPAHIVPGTFGANARVPSPTVGLKPPGVAVNNATPAARGATAKMLPSKQMASAPTPDRLNALAGTGNSKAELLLGLKFLDGDGVIANEPEAAKWLERAAGQNEPFAAYRLGTLYERGHGLPADPGKAAQWYEMAAKEGNRKAMHNLAVAYADGAGVPKNLVIAAQWFTRAANLGLADSQFNLAVLYERGMGVQQSLIDAYKWYAVAARQGDAESKVRIDALSTQLSAEDKTAAQKSAASFHAGVQDRNANIPPDLSAVLGA